MTKNKKAFDKTKLFLVIVIGVLALTLGVLIVTYTRPIAIQQSSGTDINMGSLRYGIKDNRAVSRDDEFTKGLKAFLVNKVDNSGCSTSARYTVIATSSDEMQVLLGYGCDNTDARMFAVKQDNEWKELSPTNQFNGTTNLPSCELTDGNNISVEIAPVCFVAEGTGPSMTFTYRVRS